METFDRLPLKPALLNAVKAMGFEKPSPIQAQALPVLLGTRTDFIGLAATGTGKTAAFALPLLEKIDPMERGVQAIILCPTRELCLQVSGQVNLLGKFMNVHSLPIYGGAGYDEQLRGLRKGVSVVVGTPGRVIDHLERGTLKLKDVKVVVLDEADEMISMGFREAMETILEGVPRETSNIWLFSATMSGAVRKVANDFLVSPQQVQVNRTEMLSSTVEQYFYMTAEKNKPEVLCKLIDAAEEFYGVVFCQTKNLVVDLARYLNERGYKAEGLQGDMSQGAREATMKAFRERRVKILVATDVACRGIDVKDISHVVNYSLPRELDNYVHRIGRTARSGKNGLALSLVTPSHRHLVSKIERLTKSRMQEGVIPSRKAIGQKKISLLIPQFAEQTTFQRALELMDDSWKNVIAGKSAEEVAARFISLMFPYVFSEKEQKRERSAQHGQAQGHERHGQQDQGQPRKQTSADQKSDRRDDKRRFKRDFKKKFQKGFQHGFKKKSHGGGDQPPRRRPDQ